MNEFNPSAEVRPFEEAFGAIMKKAGTLNGEIKRNDKLNIQKALEIGRMLLRARPMAAVNEWEPSLEEHGISSQRASEFMRGAEQPPEEQAKWESIGDLRRAIAPKSAPPDSRTPTGRDTPPDESGMSTGRHAGPDVSGTTQLGNTPLNGSASPAAGMAPKPPQEVVLCQRCQTVAPGVGIPDCTRCLEARKEAKKAAGKKKADAQKPREPGDDDLADDGKPKVKPPKPGQEKFKLREFEKSFGPVVRAVDQVGKAYRAKESPEAEALRKLLSEFHERFKAWVKTLEKGK